MHGEGGGADPDLVPLLDLVFQLIMFFLITCNFVRTEQFSDDIMLPEAQSAVPLENTKEDYIFLNLDRNGKLAGALKNEELDLGNSLKIFLQREKDAKERHAKNLGLKEMPKIVIVLRAHKDVRYRDVWKVLDSCEKAGFEYWQLRAIKPAAS